MNARSTFPLKVNICKKLNRWKTIFLPKKKWQNLKGKQCITR